MIAPIKDKYTVWILQRIGSEFKQGYLKKDGSLLDHILPDAADEFELTEIEGMLGTLGYAECQLIECHIEIADE